MQVAGLAHAPLTRDLTRSLLLEAVGAVLERKEQLLAQLRRAFVTRQVQLPAARVRLRQRLGADALVQPQPHLATRVAL